MVNKENVKLNVRQEASALLHKQQKYFGNLDKIHAFRITIKKFRALLHISAAMEESNKLKLARNIKDVYHQVGIIRQLGVLEKTFFENPPSNKCEVEYKRFIENRVKTLSKILKETTKNKPFHNNNDIVKKLPETINGSILKIYIDHLILRIPTILHQPSISDQQLHSIRKIIKEIIYLYEMEGNGEKNRKALDALAAQLGLFCDSFSNIDLLKQHLVDNELGESCRPMLTDRLASWIDLREKQRAALTVDLKAFLIKGYH